MAGSSALFLAALALTGTVARSSGSFQGETVYQASADSVFLLRIVDDKGADVGTATGFVVQPSILITNAHVASAGHLLVQVGPIGVPCTIVRVDHLNDLALCRMEATADVKPLTLAPDSPKPGTTVYAIGNPRGLEKTISQGLFTGYRDVDGQRVVQISAAISPGSSGGPILNTAGQVVGVTVSSLQAGQNLNFAVPIEVVRAFIAGRAGSADQPVGADAVARLKKARDAASYSPDNASEWQTLDRELATSFRDVLPTADLSTARKLYGLVVSDIWHMDLTVDAAQRAVNLSAKPDRELYANLARALYFVNSPTNPTLNDAQADALRAVDLGLGRNAGDLLLLGDIQQARENHQGAYSTYRRAEALVKPGTDSAHEAYMDLFNTSHDLKLDAEAEQWFNKAKAQPGVSFWDWVQYAAFLSNLNRDKESAVAYLAAYQLNQFAFGYLCSAGDEYFFANAIDDALPTERKCIDLAAGKAGNESRLARSHQYIASMLTDRGVYDEAISEAKASISIDASSALAHYYLARAYNRARRFAEAVNEAKTAIRLSDGKFALMHFELGSAYFGLEMWPEAQQAFKQAADMDPKDADSAYNVAVSFYNAHFNGDALTWYREVLRRDPNYHDRDTVLRMIALLSRLDDWL